MKNGTLKKINSHQHVYTNSKMEEGDIKTSSKKDVTNIEADETTLPNGFDNPLLFGSFKFSKLQVFVEMMP